MLNIPGCTLGSHTDVPKAKPEKKMEQTPVDVRFKEISQSGKEVYSTTNANIARSVPTPGFSTQEFAAPAAEAPDPADAVIATGTACLHNGCKAKFIGDQSRVEPCVYHPGERVCLDVSVLSLTANSKGAAIFHEGSKYWSCCKQGTLEFEEMVNQPGCHTGKHKFVKPAAAQGALVQCRVQSYQTPVEVCVNVFAKNVDKQASKV